MEFRGFNGLIRPHGIPLDPFLMMEVLLEGLAHGAAMFT